MPSGASSDPKVEIAHVLTMDVVEYSTLLITEQSRVMSELTRIVKGSARFRRAEAEGKLMRIPTGDGMLLVFFDDSEAPIECAMEIAAAMKSHPEIRLRMGIHSGPVNQVVDVNDRSNVAGAGVDMAQRVMDCGDAGHILLSRRVAEDLTPFPRWNPHLHDLGECEVKHGRKVSLVNFYTNEIGNPEPPAKCQRATEKTPTRSISIFGDLLSRRPAFAAVVLLLVAALAGAYIFSHHTGPTLRAKRSSSDVQVDTKSIAVLPFENRSEDEANAYFTNGIQDEILTRLAKIADLKVISRTSTQRYKSMPENLSDIGKQLGVAHLLEGSVQKSGDQVRVNVQLIKATDDSHLWAETFDRKLTDIFAVESEVATAIADKLKAKLTGNEQRALAQKPTANVEAYDAYLHGLATDVGEDAIKLLSAAKYFQRAVELDPGFALAWARLAQVHSYLYYFDFDTTPARREAARSAAETAMKLAPDSGEAFLALGYYRFNCERNIDLAAQAFENARQRLPNNPDVLLAISVIDSHQDRYEAALSRLSEALQLNPRDAFLVRQKAVLQFFYRQFADGHATIDRALEIISDDSRAFAFTAYSYQAEDDLGRAEEALARLPRQTVIEKVTQTCSQMRQLLYQQRYGALIGALEPVVAKSDSSVGIKISDYYVLLAAAQKLSGDAEGARATYTRARDFLLAAIEKTGGTQGYVHAMLGLMYAGLGEKELALRESNAALELEGNDTLLVPAAQETLARIEVQLGDKDSALARLPQLLNAHYHSWFYFVPLTPSHLRLDPIWDPLRSDPRFQKLAQERSVK